MESENTSSDKYAAREMNAPEAIKERLRTLRSEGSAKGWTFEIGYTTAMDHSIAQITGMTPPENWRELAQEHNARLARERAEPPLVRGSPTDPKFNWVDQGCVTPVRDQGNCGSCWAFGTHGALEGSYAVVNHTQADTSEQQTLDCSGAGSCNGGWWAFDYLVKTGTSAESKYPYTAVKGNCRTDVDSSYKASTWGYVDPNVDIPSVESLKKALCTYGPIAIAVAVTPAFQAYKSGVFNENSSANINHAIVLVGWDDSKNAWRIKNSWTTGWGEAGFMWIQYGCNKLGYGAAWIQAKAISPTPTGSCLIATQGFNWPDNKKFSANANIASLTFTLPADMFVQVVAESSAALVTGTPPRDFTTGLNTTEPPNVMYTLSYRKGHFTDAGHSVPVHTSMVMKLAAGTYTFYWKLWLNGATMQFDSGTITALAVPASMGGQVRAVLTAEGDLGQTVDEETGIVNVVNPNRPELSLTVDTGRRR